LAFADQGAAATDFPGTGPTVTHCAFDEDAAGLGRADERGCTLCHQLGDKTTRTLADNTSEAGPSASQRHADGDFAVGNLAIPMPATCKTI